MQDLIDIYINQMIDDLINDDDEYGTQSPSTPVAFIGEKNKRVVSNIRLASTLRPFLWNPVGAPSASKIKAIWADSVEDDVFPLPTKRRWTAGWASA
ncbi:hypothetical protein HDU67_002988 [Dinochytrium kinnereticum]|nr:hypothetical protein HDU67_002988 [Dinochytrium kinnereticum]